MHASAESASHPLSCPHDRPNMSVLHAIYARRAIRDYTPKVPEESTIQELLQAAVQAPTAMHGEPWGFVVVQDTALLKSYSDRAKDLVLATAPRDAKTSRYATLLASPLFNIFYDANTLVVICATSQGPYTTADCWLAAENFMLAACGLGLGTCCIGFALPLLNTAEVKAELGIPEDGAAVAAIILGYPSEIPPAPGRRAPAILCWKHPVAHVLSAGTVPPGSAGCATGSVSSGSVK